MDPASAFVEVLYLNAPVPASATNATNMTATLNGTAQDAQEFPDEKGALHMIFDFGAGVYDVYFSYLGWTYLNFITEELQDPYRFTYFDPFTSDLVR